MRSPPYRHLLHALVVPAFSLAACDSGGGDGADATTSTTTDTSTASGDTSAPGDTTSAADTSATAGDTGTGAGDTGAAADTSGGETTGGHGIPTEQDIACLVETDVPLGFYFGAQKKCVVHSGEMIDQVRTNIGYECTSNQYAQLVASCPTEGVVAYCQGQRFVPTQPSLERTIVIYETAVNPDADFVAKNALAVCGADTLYGLDDEPLVSECTGTLRADVDGVPTVFEDHLICLARTDGARTTYLVRGQKKVDLTTSYELTLKVISDGASAPTYFVEALQPAFGYLAGSTAGDTFGFPLAGEAPTLTTTRYEMDGSGYAASFHLGKINQSPTGGGSNVEITNGTIDIELGP